MVVETRLQFLIRVSTSPSNTCLNRPYITGAVTTHNRFTANDLGVIWALVVGPRGEHVTLLLRIAHPRRHRLLCHALFFGLRFLGVLRCANVCSGLIALAEADHSANTQPDQKSQDA